MRLLKMPIIADTICVFAQSDYTDTDNTINYYMYSYSIDEKELKLTLDKEMFLTFSSVLTEIDEKRITKTLVKTVLYYTTIFATNNKDTTYITLNTQSDYDEIENILEMLKYFDYVVTHENILTMQFQYLIQNTTTNKYLADSELEIEFDFE